MRWIPRRTTAMALITFGILSYSQCQPHRDMTTGREIYKTYCTSCHGADGTLSINNAIDLSASRLSLEGRKEIVRNGRMRSEERRVGKEWRARKGRYMITQKGDSIMT